MPVTSRTLAELLAQYRSTGAITDARVRDLVVAWVRAWDEINADMQDAIDRMMADAASGTSSRSQALRLRRARQALGIASDRLLLVAQGAGVALSEEAERMVRLAQIHQDTLIGLQLPGTATITLRRVDPRQLDAIVQRSTQQITKRTYALHAEAEQAMKRELVRAIPAGTNPRVAARRMVTRTQQAFDGGLTRAMVIARTELIDAYRTGAHAQNQANADVLAEWQWIASLTNRTCRSCWGMHGSRHPITEPGPIDHHQGRCARLPVTKSWRDLGFDIDEPPSRIPDGRKAFRALSEADQRSILTDRGYEAWKDGRYPPGRWAKRTKNGGWRDSMTPSTPPKPRPKPPPQPPPPAAPAPVGPASTSANLPRLPALEDPVAAARKINPRYGTGGYELNCSNCVVAYEHRRRGFDVAAQRLPRGRIQSQIEGMWRDTSGQVRQATRVINRDDVEKLIKSWPDGARGFVTVIWSRGRGGHIFNCENRAGQMVLWETQAGPTNAVGHLARVSPGISVLRTDDLIFVGDPKEHMTW